MTRKPDMDRKWTETERKCSKINLLAATSYGFKSHRRHSRMGENPCKIGIFSFCIHGQNVDNLDKMDRNMDRNQRKEESESDTSFPAVSSFIE